MVGTTAPSPAGRLGANTKRSAFKLTGRAIRLLAVLFCCLFWVGAILAIMHVMS